MSNEEIKDKFLQWAGAHLEEQQDKLRKFCSNKRLEWDEDIFSETVLKTAEKIMRKGIEDPSEKGYESYLFKAFTQNTKREKQYSRNARRDRNIENLNELYENYCNTTMSTAQEKLLSDLRKDFSAVYVLSKVEHEYGSESARLFTEKFYIGHTYKDLQRRFPEHKKLRDKLLEMKRWAMINITREEVDAAFSVEYADILD